MHKVRKFVREHQHTTLTRMTLIASIAYFGYVSKHAAFQLYFEWLVLIYWFTRSGLVLVPTNRLHHIHMYIPYLGLRPLLDANVPRSFRLHAISLFINASIHPHTHSYTPLRVEVTPLRSCCNDEDDGSGALRCGCVDV